MSKRSKDLQKSVAKYLVITAYDGDFVLGVYN